MKPQRTELSPGLYFTRMPCDIFKMSRLTLFLSTPLRDESAASRVALLPYVLRRGTRSLPTSTLLNRRLEELYSADLYASAFKVGDNHILALSVDVLRREFVPDGKDLLLPAVGLLRDLLFDPFIDKVTGVFSEEYVEREKKTACDRIHALQNNKGAYAQFRCLSVMCADEVYGISELGTVEEIEKITPAALFAAYKTLLSEAHVEIYYTGTEDTEAISDLFSSSFSAVHRYPLPVSATRIRRRAGKKKVVTERSVATQGKLCIGFRSGVSIADGEAAAFTLFHTVFGASPTSKLFANVRERLSLCYTCSSRQQLTKGLFLVYAGIENKNRRRAIREILHQLSKVKAGKISENEMHMARKSLGNQLRSIWDEPAALERWYLTRALFGIDEGPDEFLERLEGVTVRDVAEMAKRVTVDTVYFLRGVPTEGMEEDDDE